MGSIWLDWREAQDGELPFVCATCGDDAVEMVKRNLRTVRPGFLCILHTRVTVLLPFCEQHVRASWNGFVRVRARSIRKDGITLVQISEDFIDAVEDYRDTPKRDRQHRRVRDAQPVTDDDRPRNRRVKPTNSTSSGLYAALMTGLVVVVVASCGFGFLIINLLRGGGGTGPAGFNRPAGVKAPGRVLPPWRR